MIDALSNVTSGGTSAAPDTDRQRVVPASRYWDPEFLALERRQVFSKAWIAVGPQRWVRESGDYFTVDDLGQALIIVRGKNGALSALVNSCRHRGTRILEGRGNVPAIRCPYHDWKYSLDGRLRHVPRHEGFEAFDREDHGLRRVRVDTFAGFVWVNLQPDAPDLRSTLNGIDEEIAPYALEDMVPIQEKIWTVKCNWKAVLDNATESYHLNAVHGQSVDKHVDERAEFKTYGDHYRLTLEIAGYDWVDRLNERTARGGPYSKRQMRALHKYVIFPNFLMNVLPYHFTVFQVTPIDPDHCRFFYGFYERQGARGLEWLRARATWMASRYILREDFDIISRFQNGVRAGAENQHRFHDDEVAISHYHGALSRWISE